MGDTYTGNLYSIKIEGNVISIIGNLESLEYDETGAFLLESCKKVQEETIILDFYQARYINSVAIRMFALFLIECPKKMEMRIDYAVSWQKISLASLAKIKTDKIKLI
ncbi:MAG: hypothetical protein EHM28_06500 [Spirochaetaceae bacterium]|nr:MAG: hypothetical protein EHM28_06500 [Spirochaetaceae bacterium]